MTPVDAPQRNRALDPHTSFCVSAPAGSGKTGLLVQRFLGLLARVEHPEQVVAITFTRKAAAEMRARVVDALRGARAPKPDSDHEQRLWQLANAALKRDTEAQWGLEANPTRLAIRTIDSFCGELARQMPVLSGSGGALRTTDRAAPLYREAVDQFLRRALEGSKGQLPQDAMRLLLHLDNHWETATELLAALLERREQWQPVFGGVGFAGHEREWLGSMTDALVKARLTRVETLLAPWLSAIGRALHWSAEQRGVPSCFQSGTLGLDSAREVADLLLTQSNGWRKSLTVKQGFPPGKGAAKDAKDDILAVLGQLREGDEELLSAVRELRILPQSLGTSEHWETLAALTRLLPALGAQLLVTFQQQGEVDHAQIALGALAALGDDEEPTDLALRLDHRIEHLLVDEFQDTSSLQFELIRRVVRGWREHNESHPGQERTLLLVGDPMQSIYGFREAKVGLFMRARDEGIGDLPLESVALRVNFRSTQTIVSWCNEVFSDVFPPHDDPQLGAVCFSPADAAGGTGSRPRLALFEGDDGRLAEAQALCEELRQGIGDPDVESIAVLGRSRGHLAEVVAELVRQGIPFAARELDALHTRPVIRDLKTLVQVLLDGFDRFAWLALLRCPAVALDDGDLLLLAQRAPTAHAFRRAVSSMDSATGLSSTGLERIRWLAQVLAFADQYRDRLAFRVWLEECWLRFGGPASCSKELDLRDAQVFFTFVERFWSQEQGITSTTLDQALEHLFAPEAPGDVKVQVMTLHKAKGLEFDWVFIPGLERGTRREDRRLLLWDEFALPGQAPAFLLDLRAAADTQSPLESGAEAGGLYEYLHVQAQQKAMLESLRLLYVGCTRAENRLVLSAATSWDEKRDAPRSPRAGSFLAALWSSLADEAEIHRTEALAEDEGAPEGELYYRRLTTTPAIEPLLAAAPAQRIDLRENREARALGTALHEGLEALVYRRVLPRHVDEDLKQRLHSSLVSLLGLAPNLNQLVADAVTALDQSLGDPWLRWALDPTRQDRKAEYPLALVQNDAPRSLVIDYCFLDEARDEYWVVDYKSAQVDLKDHSESDFDKESFIAEQLAQYAPQLNAYRDALTQLRGKTVRCALYFTSLGEHRELNAV